ncbi:reverse transcriptase [Lasius niger]|uniref:Reverse transcriptase n=1 Tax=Lasius niger TaxID=67767 RepID=A0A0J7N1D9_LASNI|nr:reverse transcriptase [Lasius niger]
MAEWSIDLAVVAEPYRVPPRSWWIGDADGSVTVIGKASAGALPLSLISRGSGYVAAQWGEIAVVGVYFSPNRDLTQFSAYLDRLAVVIRRQLPGQVLVAGDLNSKSEDWGSPVSNARGRVLAEWGAELGLIVLNRGSAHTCVRSNGGSIVDVTFGSPPTARRVVGWRVVVGSETLSDHRYIRWDVSDPSLGRQPRHPSGGARGGTPLPPRWALKRLDEDTLMAAASAKAMEEPEPGPCDDVEGEVSWFREAMTQVCDTAMPRIRALPSRKAVYWWSTEIAQLRATCVRERLRYTRCRRRRHTAEEAAALYAAYREAKKTLQRAIKRAKDRAWAELLETLNENPWGRPYLMVRKKLTSGGPRITEGLSPQVLGDVISALFPFYGGGVGRPPGQPVQDWSDELGVTEGELAGAVGRLRRKNTAPGPDGIPGRAWVLALRVLGDRLRRLFTACLRTGRFPPKWKEAALVLLQKEGRPAESPSAYRPICLLDEAGKLFERVLVARLQWHLSRTGPDLADCQFGFREGRSTVDAIKRVRAFSDAAVSRGGVAMAVSLDIANAFNSLPWECIGRALEYHRVPPYMREVIGDYLRDRAVSYRARYGVPMRRDMCCGVPQGSVLGPVLWNLGYNSVLRGALLTGLGVVCYADDTLVMARGETWEEATRLAKVGVTLVVGRIRALGLTVALHKTEAVYFKLPRQKPPPRPHITVEGVRIEVRGCMKYLGLHLDSHCNFREHFNRMAPRIRAAINSFGSLLPNVGGPRDRVRRLYMGVVGSMILYGAPVWSKELEASRGSLALMQGLQRRLAIRITRAYGTTPLEAALAVSGSLPWDLLAGAYAAMYEWRDAFRRRDAVPTPSEVKEARMQFRQLAMAKWKERLAHVRVGLRAVGAIRPVLEDWVDRRPNGLPFRTVQVLTGHGCFGEYLYEKARREPTSRCHHCDEVRDTAQHTLEVCPSWDEQRRVLRSVVGDDLSLPAVVEAMVGSRDAWSAMISFCESVMMRKEIAEREREEDPLADPIRRRRGGARARAYARRFL